MSDDMTRAEMAAMEANYHWTWTACAFRLGIRHARSLADYQVLEKSMNELTAELNNIRQIVTSHIDLQTVGAASSPMANAKETRLIVGGGTTPIASPAFAKDQGQMTKDPTP